MSPAFRERLMLAVTAVNGCRYCVWFHSQAALRAGIRAAEVDFLLGGAIHEAPPDEIPALRYAVHWAERNTSPEPTVRQEFESVYGNSRAETIELVLRMIRLGNLLGNTTEIFLGGLTGERRLRS